MARSFTADVQRYRALKAVVADEAAAEGERTNASAALERLVARRPDLPEHVSFEDRRAEQERIRQDRAVHVQRAAPPDPVLHGNFGVSKLMPPTNPLAAGAPAQFGALGRWGRR